MSAIYRQNRASVRAFRRNRHRQTYRPVNQGKPVRTGDAGTR